MTISFNKTNNNIYNFLFAFSYLKRSVENRRGQRISKGGGGEISNVSVHENFEKLTLSGAFSDHFYRRPPKVT